ncbi:MAG: acyl-CoA dehydrogenase family protein [Candidatus Binatia bacterium]
MNHTWTESGEEHRLLIETFTRFAENELRPLADEHAEGPILAVELVRDLFSRLERFGLIGGLVPASDAGAELPLQVYGVLFEELARSWADLALATLLQAGVASCLSRLGTAEQKRRYLEPVLRGERIGCICVSEPAVGSSVAEVRTRAVPGADGWLIEGQKLWISNGSWSDFAIVVCRGSDGLMMLVADRDAGYTSREIDKMGLHAASTAELFFDNVPVAREGVLGDPRAGLRQTLQLFERARVMVGLTSVGIARAALEEAIAYARARQQHGKPIGAHQLIQAYVAEMATEIDAARALCHRALALLERGVRCDTETSMAKWYATEMAVRAASKAVQIHGGFGITREYRVERHFRNARIMTIPDGTTEIQKLIIGRNLLGLSAFS